MNTKKYTPIIFISSICADIITITPTLKNILSYIGIKETISNAINSTIFLFALVISFACLAYFSKKLLTYLKTIGTHGIPCEIYPCYQYKIKNKNKSILKLLHQNLYHEIFKINNVINNISTQNNNTNITLTEIKPSIESLLKSFYTILNDLFKLDLTIRIYRITETTDYYELNQVILSKSTNHNDDEPTQCYIVKKSTEHENLDEFCQQAKRYDKKNGNGKYLKNSIFDYILSTNNNGWLSNNISEDEKNNIFFSSSPNKKNYKSFAAFAILPPPEVNKKRENLIKGIISFESPKTGIYSEQECLYIMGLMAHLINDIFEKQTKIL